MNELNGIPRNLAMVEPAATGISPRLNAEFLNRIRINLDGPDKPDKPDKPGKIFQDFLFFVKKFFDLRSGLSWYGFFEFGLSYSSIFSLGLS